MELLFRCCLKMDRKSEIPSKPCFCFPTGLLVRLENLLPATLDQAMQQRLIEESFSKWLDESVAQQMATFSSHSA